MDEAFVRLEHLTKNFGSATAVDDLSVAVAKGESLTLLGPSGCGKTTTLRMIAGLETPDAGAIHIDGVPVVSVDGRINLPPERRKIGMVFQSYAIWPHMTCRAKCRLSLAAPSGFSGGNRRARQAGARDDRA